MRASGSTHDRVTRHVTGTAWRARGGEGGFVQRRRGRSFGLVGESGSGKSTVLRVVAGLHPDCVGRARHRRRAAAPPSLARGFGRDVQMVFQDPYGSLHPRQTVDRALAEPLIVQGVGYDGTRILAALADVGLGATHRFRYPHQLSGGQRQRVSIARALMLHPKRCCSMNRPRRSMPRCKWKSSTCCVGCGEEHRADHVLVSHDLAVVANMCERIGVMRQGEVLETLEVDQLRQGTPTHPYTQQLLRASEGYDRSARASEIVVASR